MTWKKIQRNSEVEISALAISEKNSDVKATLATFVGTRKAHIAQGSSPHEIRLYSNTSRERLKSALYLRLKKREIFKIVKRGTLWGF